MMEAVASPSHAVAAPRLEMRNARWLAAAFLIVVCGINTPVFLRMGLDSDVCMYDLCARGIQRGQVHYRDQLETNFPGVVWIHLAVRSVAGWSPESLRVFDLLMVGAAAVLLAAWTPRTAAPGSRLFVVSSLMAFYFSTTEWCHCQRDFWMLVPALAALELRIRRTETLPEGGEGHRSAFVEGVLWAVACWIKPYAAVPAAACWFASVVALRQTSTSWRRLTVDGVAFIAGGLSVGAAGAAWLVQTEAWPSFLEVMFTWNREYAAFDSTLGRRWDSFVQFCFRFSPWVVAVPLAIGAAAAAVIGNHRRLMLPSVFFLGWTAQAFLLQKPFDYVRAPAIFIAVGLGLAWAFSSSRRLVARWAVVSALSLIVASQAGLWKHRIDLAVNCLAGANRSELRDRATTLWRVDWTDLDATTDFLRRQKPRDGEVTCFSLPVVPIYNELDLLPSTRHVFLHDHLEIFRTHRDKIKKAVAESRQRWLVCDLKRFGGSKLQTMLDSEAPNPWKDQAVFRSGQYVVFSMTGTETLAWLNAWYGL
jgi:hypothetical protein